MAQVEKYRWNRFDVKGCNYIGARKFKERRQVSLLNTLHIREKHAVNNILGRSWKEENDNQPHS